MEGCLEAAPHVPYTPGGYTGSSRLREGAPFFPGPRCPRWTLLLPLTSGAGDWLRMVHSRKGHLPSDNHMPES